MVCKKTFFSLLLFIVVIIIASFFYINKLNKTPKNTVRAASGNQVLTTKSEWEAGALVNIDSISTPGDIKIVAESKIDTSGKTITASVDDGNKLNVIDADTGTVWGTIILGSTWWKVDLGSTYSVSKFRIMINTVAANSIQVSANDIDYSIAASPTGGDTGWQQFVLSPMIDIRYVKLVYNATGIPALKNVNELEIYTASEIATHTSAIQQIDGTTTLQSWDTFTATETDYDQNGGNAATKIEYQFRSGDGTAGDGGWSAWTAKQEYSGTDINISALSADASHRYMQVLTTLTTTDGIQTPTLSDYTIYFTRDDTCDDFDHVSISPATASIETNGTQAFTAAAVKSGGGDIAGATFSWSATGGSIPASGTTVTYTAPATAGTYTITVTSSCGGSASATVTVSDPPPTPTCSDGIKNGTETAVDCGGSCPACPVVPTCSDGIQNGTETAVDCGGSCPACPITPLICPPGYQENNGVCDVSLMSLEVLKPEGSEIYSLGQNIPIKYQFSPGFLLSHINEIVSSKTSYIYADTYLSLDGNTYDKIVNDIDISKNARIVNENSWIESETSWQIPNYIGYFSKHAKIFVRIHYSKSDSPTSFTPRQKSASYVHSAFDSSPEFEISGTILPPSICVGADCKCAGDACWCTGADCSCTDSIKCKPWCTGFDCLCDDNSCKCIGANCSCTDSDHCELCISDNCKSCVGDDCKPWCTGADCECSLDSCKCIGDDCNCTDSDHCEVCVGDNCEACDGDDCLPASCVGPLCLGGTIKPLCIGDLCFPKLPENLAIIIPFLIAVLLTAINPENLALISNFARNLFYAFAKGREKKHKLGIIYNARSGLFMSDVLISLFRKRDNRLIKTVKSDLHGRFSLETPPGEEYVLQLSTNGVSIASKNILSISTLAYDQNYFSGDIFRPSESEMLFDKAIPIISTLENQGAKNLFAIEKLSKFLRVINLPVLIFGLIVSAVVIYQTLGSVIPDLVGDPLLVDSRLRGNDYYNITVFLLYAICLLWIFLKMFISDGRSLGFVFDKKSGNPIDLAIIRVISETNGRLIKTVVSDERGRFVLALPKGFYKILAEKTDLVQTENTTLRVKSAFKPTRVRIAMSPMDGHPRFSRGSTDRSEPLLVPASPSGGDSPLQGNDRVGTGNEGRNARTFSDSAEIIESYSDKREKLGHDNFSDQGISHLINNATETPTPGVGVGSDDNKDQNKKNPPNWDLPKKKGLW